MLDVVDLAEWKPLLILHSGANIEEKRKYAENVFVMENQKAWQTSAVWYAYMKYTGDFLNKIPGTKLAYVDGMSVHLSNQELITYLKKHANVHIIAGLAGATQFWQPWDQEGIPTFKGIMRTLIEEKRYEQEQQLMKWLEQNPNATPIQIRQARKETRLTASQFRLFAVEAVSKSWNKLIKEHKQVMRRMWFSSGLWLPVDGSQDETWKKAMFSKYSGLPASQMTFDMMDKTAKTWNSLYNGHFSDDDDSKDDDNDAADDNINDDDNDGADDNINALQNFMETDDDIHFSTLSSSPPPPTAIPTKTKSTTFQLIQNFMETDDFSLNGSPPPPPPPPTAIPTTSAPTNTLDLTYSPPPPPSQSKSPIWDLSHLGMPTSLDDEIIELFNQDTNAKQITKPKPKTVIYNGLYNAKHDCYKNSIIQILSVTQPIINIINQMQQYGFNQLQNNMNQTKYNHNIHMIRGLGLLLKQINDENVIGVLDPKYFFQTLPHPFNGNSQHDATEFYTSIMDAIDETILASNTHADLLYDVMRYTMQNTVSCNTCMKRSVRTESALQLQVM